MNEEVNVILSKEKYDNLLKELEILKHNSEKTINIRVSGFNRDWIYKPYRDVEFYSIDVLNLEENSHSFIKGLKSEFKKEMEELNLKIKEYTDLKGEILALQKLIKNDTGENKNGKGV